MVSEERESCITANDVVDNLDESDYPVIKLQRDMDLQELAKIKDSYLHDQKIIDQMILLSKQINDSNTRCDLSYELESYKEWYRQRINDNRYYTRHKRK